jgi:FkbM family methyltransferase
MAMQQLLRRLVDATPFEPAARWLWNIVHPGEIACRRDDALAFEIMSRILTKSSNCIDVGCYKGFFLSHIVRLAPLGHHYGFEPIPGFANRLRKKFPGVTIKQLALSDSSEDSTFNYVLSRPAYSGLKKRAYPSPCEKIKIIKTQTRRLDDVLPPGFEVAFLKVDVEGAELQVFRGAMRTLKTYRPYIIFEHGLGASDSYGTTPEMMHNLLVKECSLQIYRFDDWLKGAGPLDLEDFCLIYKNGLGCNFLARP